MLSTSAIPNAQGDYSSKYVLSEETTESLSSFVPSTEDLNGLKFEPLEFATIEPYTVPQGQQSDDFDPNGDDYVEQLDFYDPELILPANPESTTPSPSATTKGGKGASKSRQSKAAASARATTPATAQSSAAATGTNNSSPNFTGNGATGSKTTERRAEQNRQAQKTFREKKMKYVKELEEKLEEASQNSRVAELLKHENSDLRSLILSLQSENERLRVEKEQAMNFTWNPNGQVPTFGTTSSLTSSPPQNVPSSTKASSSSSPGDLSLVPDHPFSSSSTTASPASTATLLSSPPSDTPSPLSGFSSTSSTAFSPLNPSPSLAYFESANMFGFPPELFQPAQFSDAHRQTTSVTLSAQEWDISQVLTEETQQEIQERQENGQGQNHPSKRTLSEADIYKTSPLPFQPITLKKDINGEKDKMETEICDMMKKIHCKDKNPELHHGSKYIKKAI